MAYKVLIGIDIDDKRYEPGETVALKVIPKKVAEHWIAKGVIEKELSSSKSKSKDKED